MLVQSGSGSAADPERCLELAAKPLFSAGSRGTPGRRAEAMKVKKREDSGAASGASVDIS